MMVMRIRMISARLPGPRDMYTGSKGLFRKFHAKIRRLVVSGNLICSRVATDTPLIGRKRPKDCHSVVQSFGSTWTRKVADSDAN